MGEIRVKVDGFFLLRSTRGATVVVVVSLSGVQKKFFFLEEDLVTCVGGGCGGLLRASGIKAD